LMAIHALKKNDKDLTLMFFYFTINTDYNT